MFAIFIVFSAVLIFAEWLMQRMVYAKRSCFPWLITEADARPEFRKELIEKYMRTSFDPRLGWARRPGTTGRDESPEGDAHFSIADDGARHNPATNDEPGEIAVFGDSYAFCRLVDDNETWPFYLSQLSGKSVSNFGVGNYGLDQALLRLTGQVQPPERKVVIMAIVPETIVRIHSRWKHYFEYGNILAFKPSYSFLNEELVLNPCPISNALGFEDPAPTFEKLEKHDWFFREKFSRDALRFPFLLGVIRNPTRLLSILWHLYVTGGEKGYAAAFRAVLKDNHIYQKRFYEQPSAVALLTALTQKFASECEARGLEPVLVVLPQPNDIQDAIRGVANYRQVFMHFNSILPVLDLTELFVEKSHELQTYKSGNLGAHASPDMNLEVSKKLLAFLHDKNII